MPGNRLGLFCNSCGTHTGNANNELDTNNSQTIYSACIHVYTYTRWYKNNEINQIHLQHINDNNKVTVRIMINIIKQTTSNITNIKQSTIVAFSFSTRVWLVKSDVTLTNQWMNNETFMKATDRHVDWETRGLTDMWTGIMSHRPGAGNTMLVHW